MGYSKKHTWKRVVSVAMTIAMVVTSLGISPYSAGGTDAEAATSGYTLVWSDEFEGSSLNTNYWTYEYGNGSSGWGNNELQYYTDSTENCYLSDGALHIVAKQDSTYSGYNYTSTRIKTSGKVSVKYGRVEARLKVPQANGAWPAFWMLGESIGSIGWPKCGEIDIMECVNNESTSYGTAHWDANGYASYGQSVAVPNMENEYHVYAVEWDSEYINWYVDDTLYNSIFIGSGTTLEEMHEEFFILLNVAVGGNWPGFTVDSNFREEMLVDYVRVYEASDGSTGSGSTGSGSTDSSAAREGNLLNDTALSNSASNWYGDSSVAFNGDGSATATISGVTTSDSNWTYQLKQDGLTLKNGKWYKAYFTANSSVARDVQLLLQNNGTTWTTYGTDTFSLAANTDTYCEVIFQMTEATDTNSLYGIMMGNVSGAVGSHSIQISDVGLYEYDAQPSSGSETTTPDNGGSEDSGTTTDGNMLSDAALSNSAGNWYGDASVAFNGNGSATATISGVTTSDSNWTYQVKQDGLTLTNGKWYKASFNANSSVARDIQLLLQNNGTTWAVYGSDTFSLAANTDTYCEVIFQMTEATDTNVLYGIMMGNVSGAVGSHTVTISDVSLMEYDSEPSSEPEEDNTGSGSTGETTAPSVSSDGYVYNAQAGTVTFTLNDSTSEAIIYLAAYASESEAVAAYNTAVAALPGIDLPGHAGMFMTSADGVHTYTTDMAAGTWFVYGFNALNTSGLNTWKLGVAQAGSVEESTESSSESTEESKEPIVAPTKVTALQAVYENGQIKLTWDDNGAAKYRVMRFDGITDGYTTLTFGASADGYIDTDLIDAHRYYYRVCGYFYDAEGNLVQGGVSDAVGVVATDRAPSKVENVKAAVSDGSVTLTWDAADGVRYYKIARAYGATAPEGSYACLQYNVDATTYTDAAVSAGTWRYKVVGYYKAVDGSWVYGDMCDTLFVTVE